MVTRLGVGSPGVGVTVWCLGLGFSGACVQKSAFNRTLSNTRQHGGACVERKLSKCGCVQISIPASNRFDGSAAAACDDDHHERRLSRVWRCLSVMKFHTCVKKNIIEVTKVHSTFDIIDYCAYLSDFAVICRLRGDLHASH